MAAEEIESRSFPGCAPNIPYVGCRTGEEPKLDSGSRIRGVKSSFWGIGLKNCCALALLAELAGILDARTGLDPAPRKPDLGLLFGRTGGSLFGDAASKAKTS